MIIYVAAVVGRIVKFWGMPLITAGGMAYDFTRNKSTCDREFHMLVRTGLISFRDISRFIIKLMEK
jgi:hypothetical protein